MHLQWNEAGAMGTNAIVGGGVPQAAGFAWSHQHAGTDAITVTYFGDGATNIGSMLESFNLAAAWELPVCFFIENNLYAVSTHGRRGHRRAAPVGPRARLRHRRLAGRRHGPARRPSGDGARPSSTCARAAARPWSRPTSTASSTRTARSPAAPSATATKEEENAWRERDPLDQTAGQLSGSAS